MTSRVKLNGSRLFELILCWRVRDSEGGQSSGLKSGSLSLFLKLLAFLKLGLCGPGNILLYRPHQWFMRAFVLDLLGSVTEKCSGQKANFGTVRGFTSWHQHTFSFLAEDQLYKEPYGKTSLEKKERMSKFRSSQPREACHSPGWSEHWQDKETTRGKASVMGLDISGYLRSSLALSYITLWPWVSRSLDLFGPQFLHL